MKRKRLEKAPVDPGRIRRIPQEGFSWIDRRFVREGFLERLPSEAIQLYFFLVTVSDSKGLSFYADPTIGKKLGLSAEALSQARARLIVADLILYRYPIYQVLPLPLHDAFPPAATPQSPERRGGDAMSLREFFAKLEQRRVPRKAAP